MRAIISGATGAIGTALVRELAAGGNEVLVLVRPDSARKNCIPADPLVTVKECGLEGLAALQNDTDQEFDVFYHLAWAGTSGAGRNDMYLQNSNVRYALDAVAAAKRFGCKCFIGAGSQAEYGRFEGLLTPETPAFPEMGYGYAKLCAGLMTRDYAHSIGLSHIWVRILSVYGPGDGAQSMVMSTIHTLQNGGIPRFTKGEQLWDYLYSGDAARALRLLGERGQDGKTYVLGSGSARPLRDYITDIRDMVKPGAALGLGEIPYAEKQVMYLCADISELQRDTGWSPEMDFRDGIAAILNSLSV